MNKKIKYPRTPKHLWAQVKLTPEDVKEMRKLKKQGWNYTQIAKKFDVSRSGVRLRIDARFKLLHDKWNKEHPESRTMTTETRRLCRERKLKYCGEKFKKYQKQYWQSYDRKIKKTK